MRNNFSKIAMAATLGLALAFTIGCGGDMGNLPCLTCNELPSSSSSYRSSSSVASPPSSSSSVSSSSSPSMVSSSSSAGLGACSGGTVAIGSQVWQKCNLNVAPAAGTGNSWCYNNLESNCAKYGRLYDWATAMDLPPNCNSTSCADQINEPHRGVCPSGWHVPSDDDWDELFDYVGGSSVAGRKLKATSGWYDCGPSGSGNSYLCEDTHGFSALPGGHYTDGNFYYAGYFGLWWSASEDDAYYAYILLMLYDSADAGYYYGSGGKSYGRSVRCLQDCDNCGVASSSSVAKSSSSSTPPSSSSVAKSSSSSAPPSSSSVAQSSNSNKIVLGCCKWETETKCYPIWSGTESNDGKDGAEMVAACSTGSNKFWNQQCPTSGNNCPSSTLLVYEGETYETVVIGTQTWMAENLNYNASGSKCYGNDPANCDKYGRLYDWSTAMALSSDCNSTSCSPQIGAKHRGICPSGWHVPSNADWYALMKFVNPSCTDNSSCADAGTKLKSAIGWNSSGNGEDTYGFSALPGGYGYSDGGFDYVGNFGWWWSATEGSASLAYRRGMDYPGISVYRDYGDKADLFSVRCLKD